MANFFKFHILAFLMFTGLQLVHAEETEPTSTTKSFYEQRSVDDIERLSTIEYKLAAELRADSAVEVTSSTDEDHSVDPE